MRELLKLDRVSKSYLDSEGRSTQAVADVSLSIREGEVLGLVGESGCGKSTLGRTLLRLIEPDGGRVEIAGNELTSLSRSKLKTLRRDCQIVFQDPYGSLNPRHKVGSIIGEALVVHNLGCKADRRSRVLEMLALVGLPEDAINRYPHEFSGGQRQRIAIARALVIKPRFLVADEAVSALDVSIQSQIINLIVELQKKMSLSMLFISHDLSVVRHVSDRIAVMYLGRIVEIGQTESIMQHPRHPYTQALISAIPDVADNQRARIVLQGDVPDPADPPKGCAFHARCRHVMERCSSQRPELQNVLPGKTELSDGHKWEVACHLYPQT